MVYTLTAPEGSYRWQGDRLVWRDAGADVGAHLRLFVMDAGDGRFVPGLDVRGTMLGGFGKTVDEAALPLVWYPQLNGYGANLQMAGAGPYRIRVTIGAPCFGGMTPTTDAIVYKPVVALFDPVAVGSVAPKPADRPRPTRKSISKPPSRRRRRCARR